MTFHVRVPDRQTPMGSELIQEEHTQAQLSLDSISSFQHYLISAFPSTSRVPKDNLALLE